MAEDVSMADFEKYLLAELEAGEDSSLPAKTLTTTRYTFEFAKQESLVADLLRHGYRLSTIHEYLQDKGLVSMPYNSFYKYARKRLRLGGGIKKHSRKELEQAVGKAEKADTAKRQAGQA